MLSRGIDELEGQLDRGVEVEPARIFAVAECAARLGCVLRTERWLQKSVNLYERAASAPSREVLVLLAALEADASLAEALESFRHLGPAVRNAG
jgi:hypothetical protein